MYLLRATTVVRPEARERWLGVLAELLPPSRAEQACLSYEVHESVEAPNTFLFLEEWATLEGFYAHNATPHVAAFFAALPELLAEPPTGTVAELGPVSSLDDALAESGIGQDDSGLPQA